MISIRRRSSGCGHGGQTVVWFIHRVHSLQGRDRLWEAIGVGQGPEGALNVTGYRERVGKEIVSVAVNGAA